MSALVDLSIFPVDQGESLSAYVAPVIELIRRAGIPHQLTAMGTLMETQSLQQALDLVAQANDLLQQLGSRRVYATLRIDVRPGPVGRLTAKVASVQRRLDAADQG